LLNAGKTGRGNRTPPPALNDSAAFIRSRIRKNAGGGRKTFIRSRIRKNAGGGRKPRILANAATLIDAPIVPHRLCGNKY
jgi:hypothetical protein